MASLAKLAVSNGSLRSLRCLPGSRRLRRIRRNDRGGAINSVFGAFRRLLLQIGGANIAARIALLKPPSSSSFTEEERLRFLLLLLLTTTAARDPVLRRLSISDSSHPNGGDHGIWQFAAVPGIVA